MHTTPSTDLASPLVMPSPGLALSPASATSAHLSAPRSCLSFRLGAEEYGIDILAVQEIRSFTEPTRMAGAPDFIRGVIDLRGVIVPVVDLRRKFGLGHARDDGSTVVIVLNVLQRVVGIVVDAVSEVIDLQPNQLRAAPSFNTLVDTDFIVGLASLPSTAAERERLLIVADIERLMGSADMGLMNA